MKIRKYVMLMATALILGGCSDNFLETRPTEFISAEDIEAATKNNPDLQNANIRGIYATMIATGSGGTDLRHDDFGHKGYDIYGDMLSGDMVLAGYTYGWYKDIVEYQSTLDYTAMPNYEAWRFYYRIIFGANAVIDGFGGNDAQLTDPEARHIMGQAKAMRGFAYFYLANYYGQGDYSMISGTPVLPIYTTLSNVGAPLSTGAEVYDQIITDLTDAVDLLDGFSRTTINQVDASVAKGLLAYAYATKGDYGQVKTITNEIITSGQYSLLTADQIVGGLNGDFSQGGFNDVTSYANSWMWGQDITLDNGLDLVSWWGQVDLYTYSYAWAGDPKTINIDLYNSIPATDIRKDQFVQIDAQQYAPMNKFYAPGRTIGGQRNVTTDYVYMRIEEMYLLNAEAAAKTGDPATARQRLEDLLKIRMPNDYSTYLGAIADADLLDEVYKQERIELWGEGKSYLAFKRLDKSITLPANHLSLAGQTVSYDQDKVTLDIPEEEVLNNPNL